MTDWAAVSALVSGRTKQQCRDRWHNALNSRIDRANGRKGMWTVDEDNRLEHAIQMHSGKNWGAIAALVPDRTKQQCQNRWYYIISLRARL
jgi:hypothetical protein